MTVIGLSANHGGHVISLSIPTVQLAAAAYRIRALNDGQSPGGNLAAMREMSVSIETSTFRSPKHRAEKVVIESVGTRTPRA
jgi:hypothetical protein